MKKNTVLKILLLVLLLCLSAAALTTCGCVISMVFSKYNFTQHPLPTEPSLSATVPTKDTEPSRETAPPSGGSPVPSMPTETAIPEESTQSCSHPEGKWLLSQAPTCTKEGVNVYVCTGCNELLDTAAVEATGHSPEYQPEREATCREPGSTESVVCANCGEVLEAPEILPMLEHVPAQWKVVTPATCTAEGLQVRHCSNCNLELERQAVAALGHDPKDSWTLIREGTCLAREIQHLYCTRCEDVVEEVTGEYGPHHYGDWVEDPAPTCETGGHRSRVCRVCADVEAEEMPAAGHHIRDTFVPAQGNEKAHFLRTCNDCDYSVQIPIEPIRARVHKFAYVKLDTAFTDANYRVSASGGYGNYTYKFEAFQSASATSPVVTQDFSSKDTFLLSIDSGFRTLTGFVLQVTVADEAGNRTVYRVLVDDHDTVTEERIES